jgi:hypothetical protein
MSESNADAIDGFAVERILARDAADAVGSEELAQRGSFRAMGELVILALRLVFEPQRRGDHRVCTGKPQCRFLAALGMTMQNKRSLDSGLTPFARDDNSKRIGGPWSTA